MIIDRGAILGAILGDMIGSRFQLDPIKTKDFYFKAVGYEMTDDSIMTLAIERAIIKVNNNSEILSDIAIKEMKEAYLKYPDADYGLLFKEWLESDIPKPYGSYGNGGAMRVSACGVYFNTLEDSLRAAKLVTEVTHNHPDGLKAALATVEAIYLARNGSSKEEIKIAMKKYYELNTRLSELRDSYDFNSEATHTMEGVFASFFESKSYEDAVRNAISLGGDSDTLAAITGSIAGAYYKFTKDQFNKYIVLKSLNI